MAKVLIEEYRDAGKLYLSWDAASWHMSKELLAFVDQHNGHATLFPKLELAPPTGISFGADAKLSHFQVTRRQFSEPVRSAHKPRRPCQLSDIIWLTASPARWLNLRPAPTIGAVLAPYGD